MSAKLTQFLLCAPIAIAANVQQVYADTIPDQPIQAIETGLQMNDRFPGHIGWLNNNTVAVATLNKPNGDFWDYKVVTVDARTGKISEQFPKGYLTCTDSVEGVMSVQVGTLDALFAGNSKAPPPTQKLYSWIPFVDKLMPKLLADKSDWNSHICRKTRHDDAKDEAIGLHQKGIFYLESGDGYLQRDKSRKYDDPDIVLVKDDKKIATVDVKEREIKQIPQYMPFRNEYLLSPGYFTITSVLVLKNNVRTTELPVISMSRSGSVKREFIQKAFEGKGVSGEGFVFPYAQGALVFVHERPKSGGGIYLVKGKSLTRAWCVNPETDFDRNCRLETYAMSPDGCAFAFFAVGTDDRKQPYTYRPSLKILPLCN